MEALGTKTAWKLLKVLFENPLQEFKEIDLIKSARTGKGTASQTIGRLLKEDILLEKRMGKTKVISLNLRNKKVYFLKMLFDKEKLILMGWPRFAALLLFVQKVKKYSKLMVVFGSSVAGTANERSDIDVLIVCDNLDSINNERKKVEELFGEKFNINCYNEDEIKNRINEDSFVKNAFIKGAIIWGYNLGIELFTSLKSSIEIDRLLFLHERIKSALNNYLNKDYNASKEILDKAIEQLIFYILSGKDIDRKSKRDAYETILRLPEGKKIKKIKQLELGKRINLSQELVLDMIREEILKGEGYVNRRN